MLLSISVKRHNLKKLVCQIFLFTQYACITDFGRGLVELCVCTWFTFEFNLFIGLNNFLSIFPLYSPCLKLSEHSRLQSTRSVESVWTGTLWTMQRGRQ